MIRILKIWVVFRWMRVECSPPFFPRSCPESEVKMKKTPKKLWRWSRPHSWAVTHDRRNLIIAHFFFFFKRAKTQRWTRCSGWHYGTEGVDRQIFWIIKEEIICVILVLVRMSVWAHPSGCVQTINICHADLRRAAVVTSTMAPPCFFLRIPDFHMQSKIPMCQDPLPLTFSQKRDKTQNVYLVASSTIWRSGALFGSSWSCLHSRGVSHRPVASPGPVFATDGRLRRQPCGRCL